MPNSAADELRINTIRFLAVDGVQKANSGHPGLPLGAAAMAYTLWTRHLRHNPANPAWFDRDRFILSAGHGSMLLYALLHLTGYELSLEDLKHFRQWGSKTPGHPEYHETPGVEVTTGPLGQGVGNAVGMAIAEAHLAATYNSGAAKLIDHFTYCLCGDGDLMEGVASEAASLAGHLRLGKLILLYDDNKVSLAGATNITFTEDVCARFEAYGWHTQFVDVEHGNDVETIDEAIAAAKAESDRPSIIAVRTHIGYGSPKQDSFKSHGEPLGVDDVKKTKETLGWPADKDFYVPAEAQTFFRQALERGRQWEAEWNARFAAFQHADGALAAQFLRAKDGKLPEKIAWPTFTAENGAVATREAGGTVMNAIANDLPELVGGSADLDPSTKTYLKDGGDFQPGAYGGRNIHYGVREHAMGAASNGIAMHGGLLPFTATFFNFTDYMKPAMRLAAITQAREVFVMTHDSVFLGEDGPTHQPIEQLATLRATPQMIVLRPADAVETLEAWKFAVSPGHGPVTMVLTRQKVPYLGEGTRAVSRGAYVLSDSDGTPDVILMGSGSEVALCAQAATALRDRRVKVRVVSFPSWELFARQEEAYRESVLPKSVRARVSIEAAATLGWHRWVGDHGIAIGLDHFGASAPGAEIAKQFHFTPEYVAGIAEGLLAKI